MDKIAFVLPVPNAKIIGGYKIVYEYANYICGEGYDVTIIYNAHNGENGKNLPEIMVYLLRFLIGKMEPAWFVTDKRIKKIVYKNYDNVLFEGYDVVIATATETAEYVNHSKSKKIYFVQDFEDWGRTKEEVYRTFRYDMKMVTISKWLQKMIADNSGKEVHYIPNGINRNIFKEYYSFEQRQKHSLVMLYHDDYRKGCDIGLRILKRLKAGYADFEAFLFGFPKKQKEWEKWIHYYQKATPEKVCECMNQGRVFLCTSRQEGFGLTGLESIFCGCVLVTTDCYGIREYATEDNSFLCEIDNEEQMYEAVCEAFDNEELCKEKKRACEELVEKFDELEAKKKFLKVIEMVLKK